MWSLFIVSPLNFRALQANRVVLASHSHRKFKTFWPIDWGFSYEMVHSADKYTGLNSCPLRTRNHICHSYETTQYEVPHHVWLVTSVTQRSCVRYIDTRHKQQTQTKVLRRQKKKTYVAFRAAKLLLLLMLQSLILNTFLHLPQTKLAVQWTRYNIFVTLTCSHIVGCCYGEDGATDGCLCFGVFYFTFFEF